MFSKRIKELRAELMMTQSQFAEKIGVSKQNVSDWENGKSETSFAILIRIAQTFKVSTDYLLGIGE